MGVHVIEVLLKLFEGHHIAFFVHSVRVFVLNLEAVVGKVNVFFVLNQLCCVFLTACSYVTSVIEVKLIGTMCECPHSDVKLAILE